eukprot:1123988-Pyramimonas_sp.AAC.1
MDLSRSPPPHSVRAQSRGAAEPRGGAANWQCSSASAQAAGKPPRHVHERCSTPAGVDRGRVECIEGSTTKSLLRSGTFGWAR